MTDDEPIALRSSSTAQEDPPPPDANGIADDEIWEAFLRFVEQLRGTLYGPGRGIFENGRYVITYAPGRRSRPSDIDPDAREHWLNAKGKLYPALHCTSLTNLFLSWLLRRNEDFTHGGNVPDLMELLGADATLHVFPGRCTYRGFAGAVTPIAPDGSGAARTFAGMIDARELLDRVDELPTFMVFSQSTRVTGGWNRDHHTGVFAARDGKLYRLAADGMVAQGKYTAQPLSWMEITTGNVAVFSGAAYRVWGVDTSNGSYGDPSKPIAPVELEAL